MLDTLATRYHMLPSAALLQADSLDVLIMDTAIQYHNAKQQQQQAKADGTAITPEIDQDTLKAMMNKTRSK